MHHYFDAKAPYAPYLTTMLDKPYAYYPGYHAGDIEDGKFARTNISKSRDE